MKTFGENQCAKRKSKLRFQVLTAASIKMAVFWNIAPNVLIMEALRTSETSVYFNETARHSVTEDCHLQSKANYKTSKNTEKSLLCSCT